MSTGKKIANVFGVILALVLSVVLVIVLCVTPVLMSAMSMANPGKLAEAVGKIDLTQLVTDMGGQLLGEENEQLTELLSTDAAQELYEVYVSGVFSALEGEAPQQILTEEKLQGIVENNFDQLYELCLKSAPDLAEIPKEEAKQKIQTTIGENFEKLAEVLPSAEELAQGLESAPEIKKAMDVLGQVDTIKMALVVVIVVLSGLVFVCRLHGFRGLRWLSTDLSIATSLSGVVCGILAMGGIAVKTLTGGDPTMGLLTSSLMPVFAVGVYIRTGIMLISASLLGFVYRLIKKARDKKARTAVFP